MSQQKPPAGWYDDPAGSGGRRYWNGRNWTDQVQGGSAAPAKRAAPDRARSRDRLPDGYMLLNGQRVPLGQTWSPSAPQRTGRQRTTNRGAVVAALVAIGIVLLLVVSSLLASADLGDDSSGEYAPLDDTFSSLDDTFVTLEADSEAGSLLNVRWSDGTAWNEETEAESGWTTDLVPADDGPFVIQVLADDREDVASCRILDADGSVLSESTGSFGAAATCRWEP